MTTEEKLRVYAVHLGKITSNLSIACAILAVLSIASVLIFAFYCMFLVILIILTLGLILALVPNYFAEIKSTGEAFASFSALCAQAFPAFVGLTVFCSLLSAILLCFDFPGKQHVGRIVVSVITFTISIFLIFGVIFSGNRVGG